MRTTKMKKITVLVILYALYVFKLTLLKQNQFYKLFINLYVTKHININFDTLFLWGN